MESWPMLSGKVFMSMLASADPTAKNRIENRQPKDKLRMWFMVK
ncbi:uncharacterized protein METZ01_LOCUS441243 [marine metagenome]|uniref:Uncharacterized protein n=1 Tax=marine metagenome TaxID=408172 RepID=A0A382YZM1_9ZZZZ